MTAQAIPYNVTGTGAVIATACTYRGFYFNSGAAQTVTIYDNASAASGTVLAQFTASAAGQSFTEAAPDGIRCAYGIYVAVSAGAIVGSVRVG